MISEKKAINIAGRILPERYGRSYVEKYKDYNGIMWGKSNKKLIEDFSDRILTVEVDLTNGEAKIVEE